MTSKSQSSYTVPNPSETQESDAPMTEVQAARLRELADQTGEPYDSNLTEAEAAERIAFLEEKAESGTES